MSGFVMFTQAALPLVLLAWIAFFPAAGWLALALQFASVAAIVSGLALAALWTMPPFWMPWAYTLLLAVIMGWHLWSDSSRLHGVWKTPALNTVLILLVTVPGLLGGYLSYQAVHGRAWPEGAVMDIAPPFGPGHYLVAHGGGTETVNVHLKTLDNAVERFRPWRGQSKALDIFRITPLGLHKNGWDPSDPSRYTTFGTAVLSPCRGRVAQRVNHVEDMTVPEMDRAHMAGNYVAIDCGEFFVILAHLRQGSIQVTENEHVEVGELLGQMGNSGNSSQPHLHVHAQKGLPAGMPLGGEPLWLSIDGRFLARNDRIRIP